MIMTIQEFIQKQNSAPGFVYLWTNKLNGKRYIGSHKGTIDDGYEGSGKAFKRAVEKYGIDSFTRQLLYRGRGFRRIETLLIKTHRSLSRDDFYNLIHIDEGYCEWSDVSRAKLSGSIKGEKNHFYGRKGKDHPRYGKSHSLETKAKQSVKMKGKKQSPEIIAKRSATMKGRRKSPEHRAKISVTQQGRIWVTNGFEAKRVYPDQIPSGYTRGRVKT